MDESCRVLLSRVARGCVTHVRGVPDSPERRRGRSGASKRRAQEMAHIKKRRRRRRRWPRSTQEVCGCTRKSHPAPFEFTTLTFLLLLELNPLSDGAQREPWLLFLRLLWPLIFEIRLSSPLLFLAMASQGFQSEQKCEGQLRRCGDSFALSLARSPRRAGWRAGWR